MLNKSKTIINSLANSLIVIFITFSSCNTSEPPLSPEVKLTLTQDEISCTEVWLKLKTENLDLPANVNILLDDIVKKTISLTSQDSVIYLDSLLPNKTYQFQLAVNNSNSKSNKVAVTTLDTTSHNFTWQTFTFGEHSSSVLYDVTIINENDIWAVGEIYINDSLGNPDQHLYNAVHWNGQSWELKRVKTLFRGNIITITLTGIFAFSPTDIWMVGSLPIHGDGTNWTMYDVRTTVDPNLSLSKGCGISSNNIYFTGEIGSIAQHNESTWKKIESGTSINLIGLWSTPEGNTVWTCGYSGDYANSVLIRIKDGVAEKVYEGSSNGQNNGYYVGPMSGVWTDNDYRVFLMTAGGLYIQKNSNVFFLEKEIARFSHGSYGINGTGSNNIFVCGDRFVGHWNGYTYGEYSELSGQWKTFYNVSTINNIVCAVGTDNIGTTYSSAIIALGIK